MQELLTTVASFASNYWATLALGALCAYLGIFTVLRRIVFTGAALAQAAAAGVAASFWAQSLPLHPFWLGVIANKGAAIGSLGASVASALALSRGERRGRLTADATVGVVFAAASALAVLLVWRSSTGLVELKNILAGDVLLSSSGDLALLWLGVIGVAVLHIFLRSRFLLVAYDPAFARAQGLDVSSLEQAFLASLAVAVAVALRAAGLMLVFGTLVLPPLVGLRVAKTLGRATWVAVGAAWSSTLAGFLLATHYNLPVAPTIVGCEVGLLGAAMMLPFLVQYACLAGGVAALVTGFALGAFAPEPQPLTPAQGSGAAVPDPRLQANQGGAGHAHPGGWSHGANPVYDRIDALADLSLPETVRLRAAEELGLSRTADAMRPLIEAMSDPFAPLVARAREAAATLAADSSTAAARLQEIVDGPDRELATYALRVLVELGRPGAWSLLVECLADPDVPLLVREDTHVFLTEENCDNALGYDAFATPEENAAAMEAWRAWAADR